nr:T9SS type A sorting domain-containing protein [Bacteroidales bacterium]
PYAITATLTPNTTYYFYVQATCGAVWSAEGMFTTACETVTSFPYFEGFENAWAPDCWSNSLWTLSTYGSPFEGDEFAYTNEAGSQLTTVGFELPAVADNMILEFFYRVESASNPQDLNVNLSTDGTNFTESVASFVGITNTDYMNVQYDLSSYAGQTIWVRFEGESGTGGWSYGALIDNVTIREINTETDFLTYSFPEQTGAADINYTAYTIDVEVGNATDLTGLVADFTLSTGATADIAGTPQVSGVTANDFSSPVTYSVTAEDGTTTQPWVVTVTEAVIYTETDIVSYTFPEATSAATIDATEKTVDIEVAWNADLTALVAEYELSYGATAAIAGTDQESGVTANDFTDPVIYTVTAEDGTTNTEWTVTVSVQDIPLGATCADPYTYGTINDPEVINNIDAASRELWYTFTIDQAYMDIQVSTCASVYDTKVYVYDACGGNELAYDDDAPTGFCDADNNQSLAEIDFLEAGTYYVLITTYSGSIDISDPTTGLYISGTTDFITPYIDNTTLTLTPGTQNVATGNDANAVMDVVYPATVSDDMPVDMMTDAMIDLSELTAGAVVELLDGGTSLGTYTVTGGETVWASDAFASVSRVAADMTGGQSLSWDIVISGLADGTYNVSATLYLGLDADLTAETNMTEAATDAMEINVAAPFIDLALLMPEGSAFVCDFTDPQNVPVEIENTGNTTIATGATITFYFDVDVDGTYEITEDLTLSEDLLPGETFSTMTTNTVDFSALGTYEWEATISYTGDTDANNNFTTGYTVHFNQEIEFIGAVNDTITIASTDWPYTIETNLNLTTDSVLVSTYEWELDGSTETNLTVNADGWYTLHVMTEYCETTDSVYVLAYNNINGVTADEFSVYPNPNNGQFMIEMNLVEKQDVMLSIFNSNGQLVREFKFDDVDTFARQIDMNNVAEGLYLIRINAGGKMFNSQVVVQ